MKDGDVRLAPLGDPVADVCDGGVYFPLVPHPVGGAGGAVDLVRRGARQEQGAEEDQQRDVGARPGRGGRAGMGMGLRVGLHRAESRYDLTVPDRTPAAGLSG